MVRVNRARLFMANSFFLRTRPFAHEVNVQCGQARRGDSARGLQRFRSSTLVVSRRSPPFRGAWMQSYSDLRVPHELQLRGVLIVGDWPRCRRGCRCALLQIAATWGSSSSRRLFPSVLALTLP